MRLAQVDKLIADARTAGLLVQDQGGGVMVIRVSLKGVGLTLWNDGTATRVDVRLDHALCIRSEAQARKILGLEAHK